MKTQNSNSSAPYAILKCCVKIEPTEGSMTNLQLLTKTTVIIKKKNWDSLNWEQRIQSIGFEKKKSINLQPSWSQQNSLEKTKEVPTSLVRVIWKLFKPNNFQEINSKVPPIPNLTKSLYFLGFLIVNL